MPIAGKPGNPTVALVARTSKGNIRYHPDCWTKHSIALLEAHQGRGRVSLKLDDATRKLRLSVIRKRGVYAFRVRMTEAKLALPGNSRRVQECLQRRIDSLRGVMEICELEIEELGGAPRRWSA